MTLILYVWRQKDNSSPGCFEKYKMEDVNTSMSFLEMLDQLNETLIDKGLDPIAFDHDCREGICGSCSLVINGIAHGPQDGTTACQLHMRTFKDGDILYIEPWRASAFPVIKDLVTDRSAFDRVLQKGGFISVNTGAAQDANQTLVAKKDSDSAMDAAACIGCGACVAACKNSSAMLFVGAKVSQFLQLEQGKIERETRVLSMVSQMDKEGFGHCSNTLECEAVCPKKISVSHIATLNKEFVRASLLSKKKS